MQLIIIFDVITTSFFYFNNLKFESILRIILIFLALLQGEGDEYPEAAFYMTGTLEEAFEEGRRMATEAAGGKK